MKDDKKILIISMDDYPHIGGKSTHMASLISGLEKLGYNVDVIARNVISNSQIKIRKTLLYYNKYLNLSKYLYLRKKIEFDLLYSYLKKVDLEKYDAISCQDALSATIVGRINKNLNISLTMHTYFGIEYLLDNDALTEQNKYYKKLLNLEEESLQYVKKIIAVDERIKKHVIDTCKKCNKKINVYSIVNFTNTDLFIPSGKKRGKKYKIGCIRRLVEKNGTIYAVKAMEKIDNNNIEFHIYGDGPCLSNLEEEVSKNNLENVYLHPGVSNDKIIEVYKDLDLILVPSITVNGLQEATSISAIEAMSCGIPVIASSIGGLKQMIKNGENGILVKEQDANAIAKAILKLYDDKKLSKLISKKERQYILEHHSHIIAAKDYIDIFMK